MPSITQLKENSVPIVLKRWQFTLSCQVYVERMAPYNSFLISLEEEGEALANERLSIETKHRIEQIGLRQMRALFDDEELLVAQFQQIEAPKPKGRKKGTDEVSDDETSLPELVATRAGEIQKQLADAEQKASDATARANTELEEIDKRIFRNYCQRIAHLLKSWDLTEEDETAIPPTPENIEKNFSPTPEIIVGWIERTGGKTEDGQDEFEQKSGLLALIEGAKYGPLGIVPDFTP